MELQSGGQDYLLLPDLRVLKNLWGSGPSGPLGTWKSAKGK